VSYKIIHRGRAGPDPFSDYLYEVLLDDCTIAEISHSYRGEDFHVRKPHGDWIAIDRIIEGGGPEPLRLSSQGEEVIDRLTGR
jgi:hypothetical protein